MVVMVETLTVLFVAFLLWCLTYVSDGGDIDRVVFSVRVLVLNSRLSVTLLRRMPALRIYLP